MGLPAIKIGQALISQRRHSEVLKLPEGMQNWKNLKKPTFFEQSRITLLSR